MTAGALRYPHARLYAHRGATAERPENTMPAFARALEIGVDALELDVHMSRDGKVVVSHDPSGSRMAGVEALIRESDWEEIRQWDAGWGYVDAKGERPFAGQGIGMPLLEELIREYPKAYLNVDLKQARPCMVNAVVELVRSLKAQSRVLLASFSWATLRKVRATRYEGATGSAPAEITALALAPLVVAGRVAGGRAAQVPRRAGMVTLGQRKFIERCHSLDIRVDFWTIDDPEEARLLLEEGADGIMSDDPAAIVPVLRERIAAEPSTASL